VYEANQEATMRTTRHIASHWLQAVVAIFLLILPVAVHAGNEVMGEVQFEGKTKVEKTSGVWIDGQYVGYLKELKGSKKVLLLPGEHTISVRQNGYQDFNQRVTLRPGERQVVQVAMQKAEAGEMPAAWAIVKISVNPNRAAVFLDGRFVGHVGEFEGIGRSLEVAPGVHKIKIALPGYRTFETEINPIGNQKVEVKTELVKSIVPIGDPSLRPGAVTPADNAPPPPPEPTSSPQR
jgi:hypothetical protein